MKYLVLIILLACTSCIHERDYLVERAFGHYVDCDIARMCGDPIGFTIEKKFFTKSYSELNSEERKSLRKLIDKYENQTIEEVNKYFEK